MSLVLAVLSSMVLGGADFMGGLAARRARAGLVVVWSTGAGLVTCLVAAVMLLPGRPAAADLGWGCLAGLTGSVGAVLLYRALARGLMVLVAPTAAVAAALLPVLVGVLSGEDLGPRTAAGVVVALLALGLVSRRAPGPTATDRLPVGRSLLLALGAGLSFGAFMVCLAHTAPASSLWPLVAARATALAVLVVVLVVAPAARGRRASLRLAAAPARLAVAAGILDVASSALYLVAVRGGSLAVVGLLASLAPVTTVLLARLLLKERTLVVQRLGALLAVGSVIILASG